MFSRTKARLKLEDDILILENKKKNLQMDLDVDTRKHQIDLDEKIRVARQQHEDKVRILERDAIEQRDDFDKKMKNLQEDHKRDTDNNAKEFDRLLAEKEGLLKLNYEQELAKLKHDHSQAMTKLKDDHSSTLSKTKDDLAQKHMDDVRATFKQLNMEGTQTSKFMQEMAIKMFDKMPQLGQSTTDVNVGISDKRIEKKEKKEPTVIESDGSKKEKEKKK